MYELFMQLLIYSPKIRFGHFIALKKEGRITAAFFQIKQL